MVQDVVSYLEPHARAFQTLSSGSTEMFPSERSLLRGSDMERLTRQNPEDFLRSMQFMTVPLHTAGVSSSISSSSTETDFTTSTTATLLPR